MNLRPTRIQMNREAVMKALAESATRNHNRGQLENAWGRVFGRANHSAIRALVEISMGESLSKALHLIDLMESQEIPASQATRWLKNHLSE